MTVEYDLSDLHRVAAAVGRTFVGAEVGLRKALEVNARKTKDTWNAKLYREGHAKRTGYSVTYDITVRKTDMEAEIGAVQGSGRQAYITRLLEYGSANNPPHGYGSAALDENSDDLDRGISLALDAAEKTAGL